MSKKLKIVLAIACGACCGGLAVASGVWSTYAIVFASFSTGISALGAIITGFTITK